MQAPLRLLSALRLASLAQDPLREPKRPALDAEPVPGVARIERGIQRLRQLLEHRRDLGLDVLDDRRVDPQPVMKQDAAHLAADEVRVLVGEGDLATQRDLRVLAQRRQARYLRLLLVREAGQGEQERLARDRIRIQRQPLELGREPLAGR